MNSKERIDNILLGKLVDKLANLTIIGAIPTKISGVSIGNWCQDYKVLCEASVLATEKFKIDYYQVQSDTYVEAVDYGCSIEYFDNKLPAVHTPIILSPKDALKIKPLRIENTKRMLNTVKAVELLSKNTDKYLMPLVMGPMSILGSLRGVSELMTDLYDDIEMVVDLLDTIIETQKNFIKAIVKAGSNFIYIADPVASLVSPNYYKEYVMKSHKELIQYSNSLGAKTRLHICGNTNNILPYSTKTGADILDIDHPVDYAKACKESEGSTIINGNLDPVNEVYSSNPKDIITAIKNRHELANGIPSLIMPGCELPADTPFENVLALHEGLMSLN